MSSRRGSLLTALLLTAALFCAMPNLLESLITRDSNRMDQRLRPAKSRTLTVWLMPSSIGDRKLLNELCAAFEKENDGVRIYLRSVTETELAAEDAVLPDILLHTTSSIQVPEQRLLPMTEPDGIASDALSSGYSSAKLYAIPLWYSPNVLSIPASWFKEDDAPTATPKPSSFFNLQTPAPTLSEHAPAAYLAPDDLPWNQLLSPGSLVLSGGVALQQLLFICPAQLRGELISGCQAATDAAEGITPARVQTLAAHQSAVASGQDITALPLTPATSASVRYASLCRRGSDALAFLDFFISNAAQAAVPNHSLLPAATVAIASDAITNALYEGFQNGCLFPNAFAYTPEELDSLCHDAFLRNLDPVQTLLRLR